MLTLNIDRAFAVHADDDRRTQAHRRRVAAIEPEQACWNPRYLAAEPSRIAHSTGWSRLSSRETMCPEPNSTRLRWRSPSGSAGDPYGKRFVGLRGKNSSTGFRTSVPVFQP